MPSRRFLLVEGVPGIGVCDPHASVRHGDPVRYVGHELDDCEHVEAKDESGRTRTVCARHPDPDHVMEHYRVVQHVVVDAPELRAAIKHGELKLVRECIAKNFDVARVTLGPHPIAPAPASPAVPPAPQPAPAPASPPKAPDAPSSGA